MISSLEKLSSALRNTDELSTDDAQRLAETIKSDARVQEELERTGHAKVTDSSGRTFVVRKTAAAAAAAASAKTQIKLI